MKFFKNIDSINQTLILKTFFVYFPLLSILGCFKFGIIGIIYSIIAAAFATVISVFLSGKTGGLASKLWVGKTPIWNLSERYAADFSRARYQKMSKQYDEALRIIDHVLEEQPHFNEALLLKAQIVADGLGDKYQAKRILIQIMTSESKNTDLFKWCQQLYKELVSR